MSNIDEIEIQLLSGKATIPTREYETDSGLDLYAAETVRIKAGENKVINTDIAMNIPKGFEAQVRNRSGKTSKTKLRVQLGTVDQSYTGSIGIMVDNVSIEKILTNAITIFEGDKIAQLVLAPVETPKVKVVENFESTGARGDKGYGSSDKKEDN